MIDLIFEFGGDVILIRINGGQVTFSNSQFGAVYAPIEKLQLNYNGVCREFPDLETRTDWREEAIKRFKDKIKSFKNEDEIAEYLIEDLRKKGYVPKYKQKSGHRKEVIKWMGMEELGNLFLTFSVLFGLFLLIYCKWKNKSFLEIFQEFKEMFADKVEEVDLRWINFKRYWLHH